MSEEDFLCALKEVLILTFLIEIQILTQLAKLLFKICLILETKFFFFRFLLTNKEFLRSFFQNSLQENSQNHLMAFPGNF